MPNLPKTPKPAREVPVIFLAELDPKDFAPVSRQRLGKSLAKLATAPKKKKP